MTTSAAPLATRPRQDDIDAGRVDNTDAEGQQQRLRRRAKEPCAEVCAKTGHPARQSPDIEIQKTSTPVSAIAKAGDKSSSTPSTATNTGQRRRCYGVDITDDPLPGLDGQLVCKIGDTAGPACPSGSSSQAPAIDLHRRRTRWPAVRHRSWQDGQQRGLRQHQQRSRYGRVWTGSIRFEQPPLLKDCADRVVDAIVVGSTKTASPLILPEPGGVFTYTLVIDNDSAVPVVITSLTDSNSALSSDFAAKCG